LFPFWSGWFKEVAFHGMATRVAEWPSGRMD
jgi:hypothetical protein